MNRIVDNLCDGLAAVGAAAMASASSSPEGVLVMAVAEPVVGGFFKTIIDSVGQLITSRGERRIDFMAQVAYDTLQQNLNKGLAYRNDDLFIRLENGLCKFDDILESIIRAVSSDCDQTKSAIYGRFLGNIPFHPEFKINKLRNMRDTIHNLTSFELCVLSLYFSHIYLGTMEIDRYIETNPYSVATDLVVALRKLSSNSCLSKIIPSKMSAEIYNYIISPYGKDICVMTQLDDSEVIYPDLKEFLVPINNCLQDICHLADGDSLYDNARQQYLGQKTPC